MSLPDTLRAHAAICEGLHQLMLKENRFLKGAGRLPDEASLQAKRDALAELSASLAQLRGETVSHPTPEIRAAAEKTQQIILKSLLVDRENEQLLLKCASARRTAQAAPRLSGSHFQRVYSSVR